MKARRNLTLDADVAEMLDRIGEGQGSASVYVEDLVRDAQRTWRCAHLHLTHVVGWTAQELCAACDVLNGYHLIADEVNLPPTHVAAELASAAGICDKWEIDPARWAAAVARLATSEQEARALLAVVREFWRYNPAVEQALGR